MVLYLRKESVVHYPCFTRQQAKKTGNGFAVISNMNGIQLEKYLWANAESFIIVPLSRIRKKLLKFDRRRHGHCQRVKTAPRFLSAGTQGAAQESQLVFLD